MSSAKQSHGADLGAETNLPKPYTAGGPEKTTDKGHFATPKGEPKPVGFGKDKSSRHKKQNGVILPLDYRRDLSKTARAHRKKYRKLFNADPTLKDRAARFYRSNLPPVRRAGRPGIDSVTIAIRLLSIIKRRYPDERPVCWWRRIYPLAIPGYETLPKEEQRAQRALLRERVRNRKNQQRRRRITE